MIKPLRRKFILINMFTVLVVLFVAFYCNYTFNKANMHTESIAVMRKAIENGAPENMKTFLVVVNNYNTIYQIKGYSGSINDDLNEINGLVNAVMRSKSTVGNIIGKDIRFMKTNSSLGTVIAFTNTAEERVALRGLMNFSVYIFICCTIVFLFISVYLARVTTNPVEKSYNQKQQLVADASHELKTPLTAILASTDVLLSSDTISKEDIKWVNGIKESATDMSELLNNMLLLAKADNAKTIKVKTAVNLSNIVTSVVLNYEPILFECGKNFSYNIDEEVCVQGNENELKQLVKIFLDNAKKYSFEKGYIYVSLKQQKEKALLTVFNTGIPIPPDKIDKIFDRFYRIDTARTTASGYGLGLSIAKNIAEAHSSKIIVTSDVNGTSFSVQLKTTKYCG